MIEKELLSQLAQITDEEQAFLDGHKNIDESIYYEDGNSSVINSRKLLKSGRLITIRPHTRFVHFPEHRHDYIEMVYMCSGSTTHIVNGQKVTLSEGETLILNQYSRQEVMAAGRDDIAVNFIILPQFFDNALFLLGEEETPLRRFIIDCICNRESEIGYLHFRAGDILPIQNLIENLIWTISHNTLNRRKSNEFTMGLLLLQFINHSDRLVYHDSEKNVIVNALQYIENNYRDGTLALLAESIPCDPCWLSREIKRKTGKTYKELLLEKRLSQAVYLLTNTQIKVSEIAAAVGYNNISYFYRIFQARYDMSPKEYRAANKVSFSVK